MTARLTEERQALVEGLAPWAKRTAYQIAKQRGALYCLDLADSAALQGTTEAAATYLLGSKVPFAAFARPRVRGAIRDAIRAEEKHWTSARIGARDAAAQVEDPSDERTDSDSDTEGHIDVLVDEVVTGALLSFAGEIRRTQGEAGVVLRETWRSMLSTLDHAVSRLNAPARKLVDLRYVQGLSWEAVASALGLPARTAKRRDQQMRRRLAALLRTRGVRTAPRREDPTVPDRA